MKAPPADTVTLEFSHRDAPPELIINIVAVTTKFDSVPFRRRIPEIVTGAARVSMLTEERKIEHPLGPTENEAASYKKSELSCG
jgi:hypothetical protein